MASEFNLIEWIKTNQRNSPLISVGIGDDLAVLKWPADDLLLVGVDQVIDRVHFDSSLHSPQEIGRKVMNRNLSDCAAMGCLPAAAVVAVALPKNSQLEYARQLYSGLRQAADVFECPIVGGDTATWDGKLLVSVTILGRSAGIRPITRAGAKAGDNLYVTGPLGGSILGRHLSFEPRINLGRKLAGVASAMIDLSDGLSRDLHNICQSSGVGAIVEAERIPIHPDAIEVSRRDRIPALDHAMNDGEDYELLFTSAAEVADEIRIGRITAEPAVLLKDAGGHTRPLEPGGWQHEMRA